MPTIACMMADKAVQKKVVEDTVGTLIAFMQQSERNIEDMKKLLQACSAGLDVNHWERHET